MGLIYNLATQLIARQLPRTRKGKAQPRCVPCKVSEQGVERLLH